MIKLTLIAGVDGARIREAPVDGRALGQVYTGEILQSLEADADTRSKIGEEGQWLNVVMDSGISGHIAAWLLTYAEAAPVDSKASGSKGDGTAKTPTDALIGENSENQAKATHTPSTALDEDALVASMAETQESAVLSEQGEREEEAPFIPATAYELNGVLKILLRPTVNVLRLRDAPIDGAGVGSVNKDTVLIALDSPEETRHKISVKDGWLLVKPFEGEQTGYVAAWLVTPYTGPIPETGSSMPARNIVGMNLDILHPLGAPAATHLEGLGWVRLNYNVSGAKGSEDIQAAYDRYRPHIEDYARAGLKVLLCFTHQTFGEGKDEYWPWPSMTAKKWKQLSKRFAEMAGRIASQYAGQDLAHAYQVWNEMDAPIDAVASVPMTARNYATVLGKTIQAIKAADSEVPVITGGHTSGPGAGSQYARDTIAALPAGLLPDGIAFHPYGRGTPPNDPYANIGHIDDSMNAYLPVLSGKPVWITEWGILDCNHHNPADILNYASKLVKTLKSGYAGQVAALIWYAWAMSMHNGYGLVNTDNQPIQPLNDAFRQL